MVFLLLHPRLSVTPPDPSTLSPSSPMAATGPNPGQGPTSPPGLPPPNPSPHLTAAADPAARKYDRQLRVWGADGQAALAGARVCLLGAGATGSEALKNLVLGGIAAYTVIDDALVRERRMGGRRRRGKKKKTDPPPSPSHSTNLPTFFFPRPPLSPHIQRSPPPTWATTSSSLPPTSAALAPPPSLPARPSSTRAWPRRSPSTARPTWPCPARASAPASPSSSRLACPGRPWRHWTPPCARRACRWSWPGRTGWAASCG